MGGRGASRSAVCQRRLALASALVALVACSDGPDGGDCEQLDFGSHQVAVGDSLHLVIPETKGTGQWQWRATQAPQGMTLLVGGGAVALLWTPTAFDLGPNRPNTPRRPGAARSTRLRGEDGIGNCMVVVGTLQAVPQELPADVAGPGHMVLDLNQRRAGRWRFRTDGGALLGGELTLAAGSPQNAELLRLGKGVYDLRFRPDIGQIRAAGRYSFTLLGQDPGGAIRSHEAVVELVNGAAVAPCAGQAPTLRADLAPQNAAVGAPAVGLAVHLTLTDPDTVAVQWQARWRHHGAEGPPHEVQGLPLNDTATATLAVQSAGLVEVSFASADADDGALGVCAGVGRWPRRGEALVGVGGTCSDEPVSESPPATLTPGNKVDRRHCPGVTDRLRTLQPAGWPLAFIAAVPAGWPGVSLQVLGAQSQCKASGPQATCWVTAPAAPRWLTVELRSAAPTSSHVEVRQMQAPCPWQPASPDAEVVLPDGATVVVGLCPGERRVVALSAPLPGVGVLFYTADRPFFEVEALAEDDQVIARWRPSSALRVPGAFEKSARYAIRNPTGHVQLVSARWVGAAGHSVAPPRWLPSAMDTIVPVQAGDLATAALARNHDGAAKLSVRALFGSDMPVLGQGVTVGKVAPLPVLTAPWPPTAPWIVAGPLLGQWQAQVTAGQAGSLAAALRGIAPQTERLRLRPEVQPAAGCAADRYPLTTADTAIALHPTAASPLVLSQMRVCGGETDHFQLQAGQDDLLDVAIIGADPLPSLTVTGADGRVCPVALELAGKDAPRLLPEARRRGSCWLTADGKVTIAVAAEQVAATYDLVVRLR